MRVVYIVSCYLEHSLDVFLKVLWTFLIFLDENKKTHDCGVLQLFQFSGFVFATETSQRRWASYMDHDLLLDEAEAIAIGREDGIHCLLAHRTNRT